MTFVLKMPYICRMGIDADDLRLLSALQKDGILPPQPRIAELGAQQLGNSIKLETLTHLLPGEKISTLQEIATLIENQNTNNFSQTALHASMLWKLWASEFLSIDLDGTPNALALDLNFDSVPRKHKNHYSLVTNFGTTEHIANQFQAMKVVHDLCEVGGIMIHNLPTQGYENHGLINYNLKFFWMLARENNYEWHHMGLRYDKPERPPNPDVIAELQKNSHKSIQVKEPLRTRDVNLTVVLQKTLKRQFKPPIDMPA